MKIAFSLPDPIAQRLKGIAAEATNGNVSLLVDLALSRLFQLPPDELKREAWLFSHDRRAATREDWMATYWAVLSDAMGQPDLIGNPYAPRNYDGFYAVLLLNHMGRMDDEEDPFIPYVGPMPVLPDSPAPKQFHYERSDSPVKAAEDVAATLKQFIGAKLANTKKG